MRPKAEWAIDSEPIWAQGIIMLMLLLSLFYYYFYIMYKMYFPAKVIFMHGHLKSSDSGVKPLLPEKTAKICDATSFFANDA